MCELDSRIELALVRLGVNLDRVNVGQIVCLLLEDPYCGVGII